MHRASSLHRHSRSDASLKHRIYHRYADQLYTPFNASGTVPPLPDEEGMSKPSSRHWMQGTRGKHLPEELLSQMGSRAQAALAIPAAKSCSWLPCTR